MENQLSHDLSEISALLAHTPGKPGNLSELLQHIAQTARTVFDMDVCVIHTFNPLTGSFNGSYSSVGDLYTKTELQEELRLGRVSQQALIKNMVLIEDLEVRPEYHNQLTREEGVRAFVTLALRTRHRKKLLGVIYLGFRQQKEFGTLDHEQFRFFAVQASFLLQETWLARNCEVVSHIGQEVNHNFSTVDDLFEKLQTYVDKVLDDTHSFLLAIYQQQTNTLEVHLREKKRYIILKQSLRGACQHVTQTKEPYFIKHLSKEAERLPFQLVKIAGTEENESLVFVPLICCDTSLGVLSIQHPLPSAYGQ